MNGGSSPIDSASASFWLPSARVVRFAFPTSAASSVRRSASVVTRRELSTRKRSRAGVSRVSSWNSRLVEDSDGFRYVKPSRASSPASRNCRACPLKNPWSARRVRGSSVLKTWSSSTFVRVSSAGIVAPSASFRFWACGSVSSTKRFAIPDCDSCWISARVPSGSGAWSPSISSVTSA